MRRGTCAAAFLALAVVSIGMGEARAQDYGSLKDRADAPPLWRGFYLGLHAGGITDGQSEVDFAPGVDVLNDVNKGDLQGLVGGFHAGYNAQFGPIVVGVEGDYSFPKVDDPTTCSFIGGVCETQINNMLTLRGRLGVTLTPSFLFYGTGGFVSMDVEYAADTIVQRFEDTGTVNGAVYGAGVEYMHPSGISFGLEYLRYDFDDEQYKLIDTFGNTIPAEIGTDFSTVRARINVHLK